MLCGDLQQTLPIVPRGSRPQIIEKYITSLPLSSAIRKMSLTVNMRVHLRIGSPTQTDEARVFNEFLGRIDRGTEPIYLNRGSDVVRIPDEFVSTAENVSEFIDDVS